jgi:hypothetical protein
MYRKIGPWYSKRFGPASDFNKRIVQLRTRAQFYEILDDYRRWRAQFLDDKGELHSRYQPPPMVASFMQEPGVVQREAIPVPKGPVETW